MIKKEVYMSYRANIFKKIQRMLIKRMPKQKAGRVIWGGFRDQMSRTFEKNGSEFISMRAE